MRHVWLLALTVLALANPVQAQHPVSPSAPDPTDGCGVCHGTHKGDAGVYALKGGVDRGMWEQLAQAQAPGLSGISQSCLRCHGTPEFRAREPEFATRAPPAITTGTYLGLDLSDDHPLGRIESSQAFPRFGRLPDPRSVRSTRSMSIWGAGADGLHLECTTCHDPHRRDFGPLSAPELQTICGNCHNPATYSLAGHASQPCTGCHAMHGGAEGSLLTEHNTDALCTECHGAASAQGPTPPMDLHFTTGSRASLRGSPGELSTCSDCHTVHQ